MSRTAWVALMAAGLAPVGGLAVGQWFGRDGFMVAALTSALAAAGVVLAVKRSGRTPWTLLAGAAVLAVLCLPESALAALAARGLLPLGDPVTFTFLLALPAAITATAGLLHSALAQTAEPRAPAVALGLAGLILAKVLHTLYWAMVWDTTYDPLGHIWLVFPLLAVLFSSLMLSGFLVSRTIWPGLAYLLLIPALVVVADRAQRVDFRQLTAARAAQVQRAIEAYQAQTGRYPRELSQLAPVYALTLPGPLVLYGQEWCYQGGDDYYRLGYLDREHWSSPILFGRVFSAQGRAPLKVDVCQAALEAYRAQHPDWDQALQAYGRPTPTPDFGE